VPGWTRSATLRALAMFLVAFAIRIGTTARFQGLSSPPDVAANPDSREYELIAYNLSAGGGYSFQPSIPTAARPPGTSLTLLLPYSVFGRSFLAAHAWIIFLSSATCLIAVWLGSQLAGRSVGWMAGAWLALYPGHFYYAMHFLSEPVYGFWLALAVALSVFAIRGGHRLAEVCAGIAWAMAILTRVEIILALPVSWVMLVFTKPPTRRALFRSMAVQTGIAAILISAWVVRNAVAVGVPTLSLQRGFAFWGAHNEVTFTEPRYEGSWLDIYNREPVRATHPLGASEVERDRQAFGYGTAAIYEHASLVPRLVAMKLWRLVSPFFETPNRVALWVLAGGWILTAPFVGMGLYSILRGPRRARLQWGILLIPIIATIGMCALFYGSPRFRDGLAPLFVVLAANGALRRQAEPA
jgi:4-amino-4-deoxy-L-arabinose transferase-like glycosyltransferase